jgi:hypothetical protein
VKQPQIGEYYAQRRGDGGPDKVFRVTYVPRRDRGEQFFYGVYPTTRRVTRPLPLSAFKAFRLVDPAEFFAPRKKQRRVRERIRVDEAPEPMMLVDQRGNVLASDLAIDVAIARLRGMPTGSSVQRERDGAVMSVRAEARTKQRDLDQLAAPARGRSAA